MRHAFKVLAAEALKQHRMYFGSPMVLFSMFVWPILQLAATYYTVRPVASSPGIAQRWPLAADPQSLLAFLITGALGYAFFVSLVQSSWQFSIERQSGTLELLFLTPISRLVLVIANGAGALLQNTWLFACFSTAMLVVLGNTVHVAHPLMFLVVFLALLIPAVAWGAFLNSLLMFARDAALMFTMLEEPMWLVCGVRLPLFALPVWMRAIGSVVPLTGSVLVLRGALLEGRGVFDLLPEFGLLAGISALLLVAASITLKLGEARAQRTGQLSLF
jgi:ABC-2 type transport system permease protein